MEEIAQADDVGQIDQLESENMDNDGGRCCADSVHERIRITYVYCDDCQYKIPADSRAIGEHFDDKHIAHKKCVYCFSKVFTYKQYQVDEAGVQTEKDDVVYHECIKTKKK
ncbi:hypothetical protein HCN44_007354 [Aphidius gifuensis]|uniref:Uncharacterized protein n=1 Tax=Aphidius gifuensis TaxID=684658 RepID=A0A835CN18_APHGI|nr:uncharacterized protein LOC122857200 [Aphidius gifuensis]KAF7989044.1 hypothetical protein HCN44_007354 [Aphidius gifuensis]